MDTEYIETLIKEIFGEDVEIIRVKPKTSNIEDKIFASFNKMKEDFDKNGIPDELQKVIIKIKPRPIFNRYACEYTLNIPLDLNFKQLSDENHIDIPYQQITVHQAHMESEK